MNKIYERTNRLIGNDGLLALRRRKIIVFGVGGVGGFVIEALARAGVLDITIVDKDVVDESNINRQIIATTKSVGIPKVKLMKQRVNEINEEVKITPLDMFYKEGDTSINFDEYDYIVDAIDDVRAKIDIIKRSVGANKKIISCMGTGNKLDPFKFKVDFIEKTSVCPLAKKIRYELKKEGIKKVKVLYSTEEVFAKNTPPGTLSYMPATAGLLIASEVIRDILDQDNIISKK